MELGLVDRQKLVNIADAVREKKGITEKMTLDAIASNITSITASDNNANFDFSYSKSSNVLSYLTTIDLSGWDTSNITDMGNMFQDCWGLTSLDLSNFNTGNVTNMRAMFDGCSSLTSLDVSSFTTIIVDNMSGMFSGCNSLTSLYLSNFNTSNVTSMSYMFQGCASLTSLDVSNFNTGNVTNMTSMFDICRSLTNLDVSNFNTDNVTNMGDMFSTCDSLTSLDLSNFNTSNVTNMGSMFSECSSLTSLNVSNFNTSNVTYMSSMFFLCSKLSNLTLGTDWASNSSIKSFDLSYCPLTHESAVDVINKLATRDNSPVITFSNQVSLYQSEIDVATNKGWSVSGCTVLVEDPATATVGQGAIIDGVVSKCIYVADTPQDWGQRVFIAVSSFTDSNGNSRYQWGGYGTTTGIDATDIGKGLANTNALLAMNLQSTDGTPTIWDALKEFRSKYGDKWFVPSKNEFNTKPSIDAWTSSESSNNNNLSCYRSANGSSIFNHKNRKYGLTPAIYV